MRTDRLIARGRALARCGQGQRDLAIQTELERLMAEGTRFGLRLAVSGIEKALSDIS
jgi:hypothetical protein